MTHQLLTLDDLEVIDDWIDLGVHLVPYLPDCKMPPKGFRWGALGHRIGSAEEAVHYNNQGCHIAFVLNTAAACLVDLDCPLKFTMLEYARVAELYKEHGKPFDRIEYARLKKDEWKAADPQYQADVLEAFVDDANRHCPAPLCIRSSSGRGLHWYYFTADAANFGRPACCVEIYANKRLAYITDWAALANFFDADPVPMQRIKDYWIGRDAGLDETRALLAQWRHLPPPAITVDGDGNCPHYDYETYLKRHGRAQSGRNERLSCWAFRAAQLHDERGIAEAAAWAAGAGLHAAEIEHTVDSARRGAARSPLRSFETRRFAATYSLKPKEMQDA